MAGGGKEGRLAMTLAYFTRILARSLNIYLITVDVV